MAINKAVMLSKSFVSVSVFAVVEKFALILGSAGAIVAPDITVIVYLYFQ